jgi:hypothetical protein
MQAVVSTQQAEHVAGLVLTVTLQAQDIEQANIGLTAQAIQATADEANRAQRRLEMTATVEAPDLIQQAGEAEALAKTAPARAIIGASFWPITVIVFGILSVIVIRKQRPAARPVDVNQAELTQRSWKPSDAPNLTAIIPPGDPVLFAKFADYALAGNLLGITSVEKSKAYPRDPYCLTLLPWLQKSEYLMPDKQGGVVLNSKGKADFKLYLSENTPPPQFDLSKITPPSDHNHGDHNHGNGGEVVAEQEPAHE